MSSLIPGALPRIDWAGWGQGLGWTSQKLPGHSDVGGLRLTGLARVL